MDDVSGRIHWRLHCTKHRRRTTTTSASSILSWCHFCTSRGYWWCSFAGLLTSQHPFDNGFPLKYHHSLSSSEFLIKQDTCILSNLRFDKCQFSKSNKISKFESSKILERWTMEAMFNLQTLYVHPYIGIRISYIYICQKTKLLHFKVLNF